MELNSTHRGLASLIGRKAENVPLPILQFISEVQYGDIPEWGFEYLEKHNVGIDEIRAIGLNFAYGMQAAYEQLGKPWMKIPEIIISQSKQFMVEGATGLINYSFESAAEHIAMFRKEMVAFIPHLPNLWLDPDSFAYYAGFEEMAHAIHREIDPDLKPYGIRYEPHEKSKIADHYTFNPVEIYAGLAMREHIRTAGGADDDTVKRLNQADLFIVERMNRGQLKHLPQYLTDMIKGREDALKDSGLTYALPADLDEAEWTRLYSQPKNRPEGALDSPLSRRLAEIAARYRPD